MCARYEISGDLDDAVIAEMIRALQRSAPPQMKIKGEAFPGDMVPVVARNTARRLRAFPMSWGYQLNAGRLVINARSESAESKPLFREGFASHRCMIPGCWYFEWDHQGNSGVKYAIHPSGRSVYMAGIYRLEAGQPHFSILTRAPGPEVARIHDRMPVLLPASAVEAWLNPEHSPQELLRQAVTEVTLKPVRGEVQQLRLEL